MAENLTSPADFIFSKQTMAKPAPNLSLVPPSAFETKLQQGDPWKEYAKATEEVNRLKFENVKLKEAQRSQPEVHASSIQEPAHRQAPETCKYPGRKEDLKYVDELISKQACEIAELRDELRNLKCQQREELTEVERQLTLKEREYTHNITSLEAELKAAESRYENQVDRLSREHQREADELSDAVDRLQRELTETRTRSSQRVGELEEQCEQLRTSSAEKHGTMTQDLKSKEAQIENQVKQIAQLKKYIGETENLPKAADIVRREKEALSNKLKTYESEHESLSSTVQLLNIRLNSMNEVLRLQETELNKSSTDIEKAKLEGLLLTRWREKVFALMVQQKSSEISKTKDDSNWKAKVRDLEQKLASAHNQNDQLKTEHRTMTNTELYRQVHDMEQKLASAHNQNDQMGHTLSDREAQLNMQKNRCKQLEGELYDAQQVALSLDDRLQETAQGSHTLNEFAASAWSKYQENMEVVNTAMASLKAYAQRISFASGRLEMLQGLFARREAMLKLKADSGNIAEKETAAENINIMPEDSTDSSVLRLELDRVTRERDSLASQIKQDSSTWDEKVKTIHKQYEDEISSLQQTVEDQGYTIEEKSKSCLELSEKLELCQTDLEDACQAIEELKATVAKQEMGMEQLLEEQRQEVDSQCADKLADMDRQLSDAKREHAKAVVSLRQLERQSAREKERLQDEAQTTEEHYRRQIEALQERAQALEKERNLMMATLRQEGLIGKLKSERAEPVTLDWDKDKEPVHDQAERSSPREATTTHVPQVSEPEEPLTAVLEDLQSLTEAVLNDNSESGSDEET